MAGTELELPGLVFSGFFFPNEKLFLFLNPNVLRELFLLKPSPLSSWSRLSRRSRSWGSVSDSSVSDITTAGLRDVWVGGTDSGAFFSLLDEFVPGMSLLAIALNRSRYVVSFCGNLCDLLLTFLGLGWSFLRLSDISKKPS